MIKFKVEKFEGPLSLLLKMIEKEEMDITTISLAKIADQYVEYIKSVENINPDEMADFLVIASKLLLIKTKALLPFLYPEQDEEVDDLERQLKMYKEFIEATKVIEDKLKSRKFMFAREFNRRVAVTGVESFSPPKTLTKLDIKEVFAEVVGRLRPPEKLEEETLYHKITIEEKILEIQKEVLNQIKVSFSRILSLSKNKTEIIVNFLAALELMRQKQIDLDQDELFGEITMQAKKDVEPKQIF